MTTRLLAMLLVFPACASTTGSVEVVAERSAFTPASLVVSAGTTVTFRIVNADPIAHEFIIGTPAEHLVHEAGTDRTHDGAPGATSLDPGEAALLTYAFGQPGTFEFACHLPGHYAYGMRGEIVVR